MADPKTNRFTRYFTLLLDALRTRDPAPMRPGEVIAWIRQQLIVPDDDLTRTIVNGTQTIFENDVHWTRFYLVKAGLVSNAKRGSWSLTDLGRDTRLDAQSTAALYARVRDALPPPPGTAAPGAIEDDEERAFWFVGAVWGDSGDQLPRFIAEGVWQNGNADRYLDLVRQMRPGDRVAVKAAFVRKAKVPFDVGGRPVSAMRIKRTGTVLGNLDDGRTVKVAWDPAIEPRDWYFYTYLATIAKIDGESECGRRVIAFAFQHKEQDYDWFLHQPYWAEKYGPVAPTSGTPPIETVASGDVDEPEVSPELETSYGIDEILAEGCFLDRQQLHEMLQRWKAKKNLVLQGPPGTGKTWLAKRLGFALVGSNDREAAKSRLRVIQFHPSLSYEDFVRGWRPAGDGKLTLVDGIMLQAIDAAASEPDRPFVLVIEEINRGNPSQIFGEMLTLLENTKRRREEAIELAYRKVANERVHVPDNLYIIGTMNIADRSLALVDLALRRRFAFVDLHPILTASWTDWCLAHGLDAATCGRIAQRVEALNKQITETATLGAQFRIGHSYVTPSPDERVGDAAAWFREKVDTEIGPLLDEYWYDALDTAKQARDDLLLGFGA